MMSMSLDHTARRRTARLERLGAYLQVDPDNVNLLREYAREAFQCGEHRACATAGERLAQLVDTTVDDVLLQARALRLDGRTDNALACLAPAQQGWPGDHRLAVECAACLFANGTLELAIEALPQQEPGHPESASACGMRVRLLHHLGRLDEGARVGRDFIRLHAGAQACAPVTAAMLPLLMDLSRFDEAHALAQSLLGSAANPERWPYEVCEPLAAAALDDSRPEAARQWLDAAMARRRDDGRIWLLKGLCDLRSGLAGAAIDALEQAVDLMPTHAGSLLALGWACLVAGDIERASAAFESGAGTSPSFSEAHGSMAVVCALRGQEQEAKTLVRKALRLDPHCASAQWAARLLAGDLDAERVKDFAAEVVSRSRGLRRKLPEDSPNLA